MTRKDTLFGIRPSQPLLSCKSEACDVSDRHNYMCRSDFCSSLSPLAKENMVPTASLQLCLHSDKHHNVEISWWVLRFAVSVVVKGALPIQVPFKWSLQLECGCGRGCSGETWMMRREEVSALIAEGLPAISKEIWVCEPDKDVSGDATAFSRCLSSSSGPAALFLFG